MMRFAVPLIALLSIGAIARPLIYTKHEFKGDEDGKTNDVNQLRLGYDIKLDNVTPWVHAGLGVKSPKGSDVFQGDDFTVLAVGATIKPLKSLTVKAKYETFSYDSDQRDWKFEVKTKYYLQ
tara:strand:- start:1416 stop:1781 length:366 start_codon:yes stop_codon:yes gene_type:complete